MSNHVNSQLNQLPVGTWQLDPSTTTITVTATKLGAFTIPATLDVSAGTIEVDADHQVAAVEVTADAGSYTSRNAKRNDHVRSADFLDADNDPHLVFRADAAAPVAGGYHTDGLVILKGKTSPLRVEITDVDFSGDRGTFRATATVDRNDAGVDKLPSFIVGRRLQLAVEATVVAAGA